jgi:hypothetical protein
VEEDDESSAMVTLEATHAWFPDVSVILATMVVNELSGMLRLKLQVPSGLRVACA